MRTALGHLINGSSKLKPHANRIKPVTAPANRRQRSVPCQQERSLKRIADFRNYNGAAILRVYREIAMLCRVRHQELGMACTLP